MTQSFQERIGHAFRDASLLRTALTHSSWVNEQSGPHTAAHNERLEFLGDAVLELCVTEQLYSRFPSSREGDLTRMRSELVSTASLAGLARETGIAGELRMGRGEEMQGGRERDPLLADAMEAVLGAVYLDGGIDAARQVVGKLFEGRWPSGIRCPQRKDNKTRLQEATQSLRGKARGLPVYTPAGCTGPEHAPVFAAKVTLPDGRSFLGTGVSRRTAEQDAARLALKALGE